MTSYLASYDISSNRIRTQIARVLQRYGQRLQKSVFLIWLDDDDVGELKRQIGARLAKDDAFELIPIDLNPNRHWMRWQQPIDFADSVRVYW